MTLGSQHYIRTYPFLARSWSGDAVRLTIPPLIQHFLLIEETFSSNRSIFFSILSFQLSCVIKKQTITTITCPVYPFPFITAVLLHQTDNINHSPYCRNGRAGQSQNKILMKVKHQCAKKVVSDSLGLVDFAIGLVIFVLNKLPEGQVLYFGEIQITEAL